MVADVKAGEWSGHRGRVAVIGEQMEEEGAAKRKNREEHSTCASSVLERQPFLFFPTGKEIFEVISGFGGC